MGVIFGVLSFGVCYYFTILLNRNPTLDTAHIGRTGLTAFGLGFLDAPIGIVRLDEEGGSLPSSVGWGLGIAQELFDIFVRYGRAAVALFDEAMGRGGGDEDRRSSAAIERRRTEGVALLQRTVRELMQIKFWISGSGVEAVGEKSCRNGPRTLVPEGFRMEVVSTTTTRDEQSSTVTEQGRRHGSSSASGQIVAAPPTRWPFARIPVGLGRLGKGALHLVLVWPHGKAFRGVILKHLSDSFEVFAGRTVSLASFEDKSLSGIIRGPSAAGASSSSSPVRAGDVVVDNEAESVRPDFGGPCAATESRFVKFLRQVYDGHVLSGQVLQHVDAKFRKIVSTLKAAAHDDKDHHVCSALDEVFVLLVYDNRPVYEMTAAPAGGASAGAATSSIMVNQRLQNAKWSLRTALGRNYLHVTDNPGEWGRLFDLLIRRTGFVQLFRRRPPGRLWSSRNKIRDHAYHIEQNIPAHLLETFPHSGVSHPRGGATIMIPPEPAPRPEQSSRGSGWFHTMIVWQPGIRFLPEILVELERETHQVFAMRRFHFAGGPGGDPPRAENDHVVVVGNVEDCTAAKAELLKFVHWLYDGHMKARNEGEAFHEWRRIQHKAHEMTEWVRKKYSSPVAGAPGAGAASRTNATEGAFFSGNCDKLYELAVLVVHDPSPEAGASTRDFGEGIVNKRLERVKGRLREELGGNFIHMTDNPEEWALRADGLLRTAGIIVGE